MPQTCKHYIKSKGRQCQNKVRDQSRYCHLHKSKTKIKQKGGQPVSKDDQYVSPYMLKASELPPDPTQSSWYHYQAPDYQRFGDYVCVKKSFLNTVRDLFHDLAVKDK